MRTRLLIFLLCWIPIALADGLPDLGEAAQSDLSPHTERKIGESILHDIRLHESAYLDDPEVEDYLNRLGKHLASQSEEARQEFDFFVLRDATLNAFAMPGGYIGVHTGLILAARSESELAGVLAHEISHVTQRHLARLLGKQNQAQMAGLLSIALAILASRQSADLAQGALIAGQAAGVQHQLNYSRDFEQEADRLGLQLLEKAGFDVRGMAGFFDRLQKFGRLYENNAPGYLRTHPLTTERLADMENRIRTTSYRQVPDSTDFMLVRARLRASEGVARDAVLGFESRLTQRKFTHEAEERYGLARAHLRVNAPRLAKKELDELRRMKMASPMIETLAAEILMAQGEAAGAFQILKEARVRYPQSRAIIYALMESLLTYHPAQAVEVADNDLQSTTTDARMHALQARAYALLGKKLQQHRAQAEAYAHQGQLTAAIEQLHLAQKAPDGDFYEHSRVDARLRELVAQQLREKRKLP